MERRDWRSTATLLRGALDRVERHIQSTVPGSSSSEEIPSTSSHGSDSTAVSQPRETGSTARSEFDRLFGYRPDVSQRGSRATGKKRKGPRNPRSVVDQKRARSIWKKDTVCLRFKDQSRGPDTLEKMELAKLGLGLKELSYDIDGDALHIHSVLLDTFKQLDDCGGYTLLRLAANSTSLIEIKPPKGGMTVRYLKDIVKSAKLFVRPLQADIESEEYMFPEVNIMPPTYVCTSSSYFRHGCMIKAVTCLV